MSAELETLIAEQRKDAAVGHRVYSISLHAPFSYQGGWLYRATERDSEGVIRLQRPEHRCRRIRGLLGHQARLEERRKLSGRHCIECGAPVMEYSERCRDCIKTIPHVTDRNCRCADCRLEKRGKPNAPELYRAKTHCAQGHLFDDENTGWTQKPDGLRRYCKTCNRERATQNYRRLSLDERRKRNAQIVAAKAARRPPKLCSGCGILIAEETAGCRTCYLRHKARRWRAGQRAA